MNLVDVLRGTAAAYPDRPAVTDLASDRTLTYAELERESARVTALLEQSGVVPGQRIGLVAPNSIEYLAAAFGLLATGACLVPLAANLTDRKSVV